MNQLAGYIGRKTTVSINHVLNLFAFSIKIAALFFERPVRGGKVIKRAAVEQVYFTGVQALPIIIPVSLIIGSTFISRIAWASGQYDLGKVILILFVREIGPIITALVVILRSASAVTIEISYMNILHEIDALEMAGMDPMRIISLPRFVGISLAVFCLFIVFSLVSIIGGWVIVWIVTSLPMGNFFSQMTKAITLADVLVGMIKTVSFGFIITVVTLYHGFQTRRQVTQIPQVTSRASIESFFYCLVMNIAISALFYI